VGLPKDNPCNLVAGKWEDGEAEGAAWTELGEENAGA